MIDVWGSGGSVSKGFRLPRATVLGCALRTARILQVFVTREEHKGCVWGTDIFVGITRDVFTFRNERARTCCAMTDFTQSVAHSHGSDRRRQGSVRLGAAVR
jgi:hypothetical protein